MISTIFPNSTQDIDTCIALCSDPLSRVALSGVNKTAYFILSKKFFERCFKKEHPLIQEDGYKNSLGLLCTCHPNNCWKVASCYFATYAPGSNYIMAFSHSFLREPFPTFQALIKSRKESAEIELKQICGSYYADPDSLIDQAWKAYEASKKAYEESKKALSNVEVDSFGNKNLELVEVVDAMRSCHTSEGELIAFLFLMDLSSAREFRERAYQADRSSIEKFRSDEVFKININSFEELRELIIDRLDHETWSISLTCSTTNGSKELKINEDYLRLVLSESLFNEYLILFKFMFDKNLQACIKCNEESELRQQYDKLDRERENTEKDLIKINKCLDELNLINSGSILGSCNHACFTYQAALSDELYYLWKGEESKNNISHLNQCLIALDKADKHPENFTFLEPVRYFINLCSDNVKTEIWRTLYERCANGVIEDYWSENHYGEFLPELKKIIEAGIENCKGLDAYLKRQNSGSSPVFAFVEKLITWS